MDTTELPDGSTVLIVHGPTHGRSGDPNYPSPRRLRRALALMVDWLIHFGCVAAVYLESGHLRLQLAILTWIAVSFAHRVFVQWILHGTIGKTLFGLCVVRPGDGAAPRLVLLLISWLAGSWAFIRTATAYNKARMYEYRRKDIIYLPVVRRRDVRALRTAKAGPLPRTAPPAQPRIGHP